eukprot:UN34623
MYELKGTLFEHVKSTLQKNDDKSNEELEEEHWWRNTADCKLYNMNDVLTTFYLLLKKKLAYAPKLEREVL